MFASVRKTLTTRHIRTGNRLTVLHALLTAGTTHRQELSRLTGLSLGTVNTLVGDLMRRGLVREVGTEHSQGGRPITTFAINPNYGVCVGIDCSETHIHFALFDLTLRRMASADEPVLSAHSQPEAVVTQIARGLHALLAQSGTPPEAVVGVGISIHGPFEHNTGVSVFSPYWGWRDVPIQALLEEALPYPLYLDNPLKFNAIAEQWLGEGRGVDNFVSVFLGTGVGAGIVIDGALHHGASNTAGEWGHTPFIYDGRPCRCGSRGCLEAYIGASGLIQTLRDSLPHHHLPSDAPHIDIIRQVVASLKAGNREAQQACEGYARMLGAGLATLVNIVNPELIILGSWLAREMGEYILPVAQDTVARHALARSTPVVLSRFEQSPVSLGGAAMALERFLSALPESDSATP